MIIVRVLTKVFSCSFEQAFTTLKNVLQERIPVAAAVAVSPEMHAPSMHAPLHHACPPAMHTPLHHTCPLPCTPHHTHVPPPLPCMCPFTMHAPPRTDRRLKKHYLSATTVADGINTFKSVLIFSIICNLFQGLAWAKYLRLYSLLLNLFVKVCLSRSQLELLSDYRRKLQEERQQELQAQLRKQMSEANEVCDLSNFS